LIFSNKKGLKLVPLDSFDGAQNSSKEISIPEAQIGNVPFGRKLWAIALKATDIYIYIEADDNTLDCYEFLMKYITFSSSSNDFYTIKQLVEKIPF
jgi:hypothetical protein